jgi:hypothetical protein
MDFVILEKSPEAEVERAWNDFLAQSDHASHYTSPGFFREPFWDGKNPFAALAWDGEKIVGVLTGLDLGNRVEVGIAERSQIAISRAADQAKVLETLWAGLAEKTGGRARLFDVFSWQPLPGLAAAGFAESKYDEENGVVVLDISKGADEVFKGFSQSRRADLRKAMREKSFDEVKPIETLEELAQLHAIHIQWCEGKGVKADTWEMFESMFNNREHHLILIAKIGAKVIAGSYFRFAQTGMVEYAANNSLTEYQRLRPNDLLVWKSIEWACERGYTSYSMGGAHLFLRRFGGEIILPYRYRLDRSLFRAYEKREAVQNILVKTYRALPGPAKQGLKTLLGKGAKT